MTLSEADIIAGLKKGTAEGTVYPVFLTAADSEVGVTALLRSIVNLFTSIERADEDEAGQQAPSS